MEEEVETFQMRPVLMMKIDCHCQIVALAKVLQMELTCQNWTDLSYDCNLFSRRLIWYFCSAAL